MPKQEVFLDETIEGRHVQVLKTYDPSFAREAFEAMNEEALKFLSLRLDVEGLPEQASDEFSDMIWQEVEDGAREDWNKFSYFVVTNDDGGVTSPVFVSADWPTSEAFAKAFVERSSGRHDDGVALR